jgi:hypothetical protein
MHVWWIASAVRYSGSDPYVFSPGVPAKQPHSTNIHIPPIPGMRLMKHHAPDLSRSCQRLTCNASEIHIMGTARISTAIPASMGTSNAAAADAMRETRTRNTKMMAMESPQQVPRLMRPSNEDNFCTWLAVGSRGRLVACGQHFPGETAPDTDCRLQGNLLRSRRRIDRVCYRKDRHRVHTDRLPASFFASFFGDRAGRLMISVCVWSIDHLLQFASSSPVVATASQSIPVHIPYTETSCLHVHPLSGTSFRTTYRQH